MNNKKQQKENKTGVPGKNRRAKIKSLFEQRGGSYTLGEAGLYYPNLALSEEEKAYYEKFGMLQKMYLKENRKELYSALLIRKMQGKQGTNEDLKSKNQMA